MGLQGAVKRQAVIMLALLIFYLLSFCIVEAQAQVILPRTLEVYVYDMNMQPIQGATVTLYPITEPEGPSSTTTDSEGRAAFTLYINEKRTLRVEKEGYETFETEIEAADSDMTVKVQLAKEGEGEGGIIYVTGQITGLDDINDVPDIWVDVPDFWADPIGCTTMTTVNGVLWILNNGVEIVFDLVKMFFGWIHGFWNSVYHACLGLGLAAPFAVAATAALFTAVIAFIFLVFSKLIP